MSSDLLRNIKSYYKYHMANCLLYPIKPCLVGSGVLTAFDVLVQQHPFNVRTPAIYFGGLYVYNILQCPMEAVHGRTSGYHNILSGAICGYVGVKSGKIGVPFVDPYFFYRNPQISPPMAGAIVYGGLAGVMSSVLGNKPL